MPRALHSAPTTGLFKTPASLCLKTVWPVDLFQIVSHTDVCLGWAKIWCRNCQPRTQSSQTRSPSITVGAFVCLELTGTQAVISEKPGLSLFHPKACASISAHSGWWRCPGIALKDVRPAWGKIGMNILRMSFFKDEEEGFHPSSLKQNWRAVLSWGWERWQWDQERVGWLSPWLFPQPWASDPSPRKGPGGIFNWELLRKVRGN